MLPKYPQPRTANEREQPIVVYAALWPWDDLYNRSQPLALALARRGCRVYYLSPRERRRLATSFSARCWARSPFGGAARVVCKTGAHPELNLVEVASRRGRFRKWWTVDYSPAAERALSRFLHGLAGSGRRLRLIVSRPQRLSLLRMFPWPHVTVDVVDPWPEMEWGRDPCAEVGISQMLARADLLVSNGRLTGDVYRGQVAQPICDLPNGVEAALIAAVRVPGPVPAALRVGSGRYRVLFTGAINNRIHYDLLASVIRQFGEIDFHFVGAKSVPRESESAWRRIMACPNSHHIGRVPYSEIPQLLAHADGLLLPYSEWGSGRMFPAKLLEYVAAARPIFSPQVAPELQSAAGAFSVYHDAEGLCCALSAAQAQSFRLPDAVVASCRRLADESTWDKRAEALCAMWNP